MSSLFSRQRWAAAALAALCASGCGAAARTGAQAAPPDLVLVVLCSLRLDHLGFAGYGRASTPFLDALADSGATFENAFSASSWTTPATASLLSGLPPNAHRLVEGVATPEILAGGRLRRRVLDEGVTTLPETLRAAGYATFCRVNNVNAGSFFGLTQGCDDELTRYRMSSSRMLDDLGAWLARRDREKPFFALLFTLEAHAPYAPDYAEYLRFSRDPEPVAEDELASYVERVHEETWAALASPDEVPPELRRRWIDLYDAALATLDRRLSRLPEVLRRAEAPEATIIVTADHGESFFEPGRRGRARATHGFDLSDAVVRVPLLFHGPGIAPRRIGALARSVDLHPTLAELAGAEAPAGLPGRSLVPWIHGELAPSDPGASPVTAFLSRAGNHHAVHDGRYKLEKRGRKTRLFDVANDPGELVDLAAARPADARRLERELEAWLARERTLRATVAEAWSEEPEAGAVEELRALGYL